jgi:hypothetical protein
MFSVSTSIQSLPETIWGILVDGTQWSQWNPTIVDLKGTIAPGETVTVYAKLNPERAFPVKVSAFVPCERMVWTGGLPLGLFTGERTYSLTPQPDGSVAFAMREVYTGLLAPLITRAMPDLQPSDAFAAALKQRAEAAV